MTFDKLRIKDVHSVLRYRPHMKKWSVKNRKNHIIGIQLHGLANHEFEKHNFVLSRNCVYFFNQRDNYTVDMLEQTEAFSIHFTTYGEIETDSFCVPIENADKFILSLQRAEILSQSKEINDLYLLSTVYKICNEISRAQHKAYLPKNTKIITAKDYMDTNFKNSNCLASAIEQSGLSSRRFNDLFKNCFNITPNRYIIVRRIELAKSLLETKNLTITEISELCGFSDVYYFSKVFKQNCGISPSKWV